MDNFPFFAVAYLVLVIVFFIYSSTLQKKIQKLQSEVDQLKNK
jgi:type VI protein secretion system component VasF